MIIKTVVHLASSDDSMADFDGAQRNTPRPPLPLLINTDDSPAPVLDPDASFFP